MVCLSAGCAFGKLPLRRDRSGTESSWVQNIEPLWVIFKNSTSEILVPCLPSLVPLIPFLSSKPPFGKLHF